MSNQLCPWRVKTIGIAFQVLVPTGYPRLIPLLSSFRYSTYVRTLPFFCCSRLKCVTKRVNYKLLFSRKYWIKGMPLYTFPFIHSEPQVQFCTPTLGYIENRSIRMVYWVCHTVLVVSQTCWMNSTLGSKQDMDSPLFKGLDLQSKHLLASAPYKDTTQCNYLIVLSYAVIQ